MPLVIFIWLISVVRLVMLRSTRADRRVTTALIFAAVCCLLRARTVQSLIIHYSGSKVSPALLYHLSELAVIPAAGALFLVGYAWLNDVEPPYLARLVYVAVTACTLSTFVLWLIAREKDVPFTVHSGWAVIAYSSSLPAALAAIICHDSLVYWFAVIILITCLRELSQSPSRRAVVICAAVGTTSLGILTQTATISVATVTAATGGHNSFIDSVGVVDRFSIVVWTYIGAAVAAVPLFSRILEVLHLDTYSRRRKRLMPLWCDLTDVCPEIVYLKREHGHVVKNPSRYRLHRTVVEIRDCILILSRYAGHQDRTVVGGIADPPALRQAVRLALAWSAKSRGEPPSEDFAAQQSAAIELVQETEELSQLTDYWGKAKALAAPATSRERETTQAS
ncbi:MAG: DUF6545 domain-containing protein [Mycobacterium sp.]|uniref:DUF6545 domain-containing protein n=1 Tax=Mycobacterium sp. TaxID=1785 RepID=UPI003CC51CFD